MIDESTGRLLAPLPDWKNQYRDPVRAFCLPFGYVPAPRREDLNDGMAVETPRAPICARTEGNAGYKPTRRSLYKVQTRSHAGADEGQHHPHKFIYPSRAL